MLNQPKERMVMKEMIIDQALHHFFFFFAFFNVLMDDFCGDAMNVRALHQGPFRYVGFCLCCASLNEILKFHCQS